MATAAAAPPPAPARLGVPESRTGRTKTTYVILREKQVTGQDAALVYEPVTSGVEANSADHALKVWADTAKAGTENGLYVAIPSRSFNPTKITFSQTTVVKVG